MISETSKNIKSMNNLICYKIIEKMFSYYPYMKPEVLGKRAEMEVPHASGGTPTGFRAVSHDKYSYGSPVEEDAMRNLCPIPSIVFQFIPEARDCKVKDPEKWMFVVDYTLDYFERHNKLVADLLNARYLRGLSPEECISKFSSNKPEYYRLLNFGISFALAIACQIGLVELALIDRNRPYIFLRGVCYSTPVVTFSQK